MMALWWPSEVEGVEGAVTSVPPEEPSVPPGMPPAPPGGPPAAPGAGASWEQYPAGPPAPVSTVRNGLGVAALVLGILSLVFMILFPPIGVIVGILAVVFGIIGVRRARRGEATNRGQDLAGGITGGIGLVISVALLAIVGAFIFSHRSEIDTYTRCLQNAHTQHARDVCQTQFQNSVRGR